jgi:hypothetical protein
MYPIHPIGPHTHILGHFRPFPYCTNFDAKRGQTDANNAQVRATKSHAKFLQQTHQIHPIGSQSHVLVRIGPFYYGMNFDAKWGELVQLVLKFVQRCHVGIFCNKMHPINTIGP